MNHYKSAIKSGILLYSLFYSYGFFLAYGIGAEQYVEMASVVNITITTVAYLTTFFVLGTTYWKSGGIEERVDRALKFFGGVTWLPGFHLVSTFVTTLTFALLNNWTVAILYALMGFTGYVFLLTAREA